ncbi:WxL domain-containing protein [Enterococcus rotai]|uniref:WxL domain-containing protein n=1 Tax=Enterococcus rotai TaxID=118060 RepID=UPI0032B476CA
MKKTIIYAGICAVVITNLFIETTTVTAATEENKTVTETEGKASFVVPSGYVDTVKPGTDDAINIDGGQAKLKGVQLLHAPQFNFGENELKSKTDNIEVIHEEYTVAGDATNYAIPLFVQVGDFSEGPGTDWKVAVSQAGSFKVSGKDGHTLKNSRIRIYNQSFTNNLNDINASNMISGITIPSDPKYATIPVTGETPDSLPIIASKKLTTTEGTTHGTISSVVFKNNYIATDYGTADSPAVGSRYNDVQLNVPIDDKAQMKEYSTKLEWTLTVEP